jgi:hypothetical protein
VGVGAGEAGEFAPAHAGVGGGDDEELVAGSGDPGGDLVDLAGGSVRPLSGALGDDPDALARVVGDAPSATVSRMSSPSRVITEATLGSASLPLNRLTKSFTVWRLI